MPKARYTKKIKGGNEYFFYRFRHRNLRSPRDLYGKTQGELDEKIKSLEYELDRGVTSEKAFFGDYITMWFNEVHSIGKKNTTITNYKHALEPIKNSQLERIQLRYLTALDIQDFYSKLSADGVSLNSIGRTDILIKPCIRYAFAQGKILVDFSKSIILPKNGIKKKEGTRREGKALSIETQKKFIEAIKGTSFEMLYLFILNTGLRLGEALALQWSDIDFTERTVSVVKNVTYGKVNGKCENIIQKPKTEAGTRQVPIPVFICEKLREYKAKQSERILLMANQYHNDGIVFPNQIGQYTHQSHVNATLTRIRAKYGLEHFNIHDLRHTYATRLFEEGEDPKIVQSILGHASMAITLDTYTHVMEGSKQSAALSLDNIHKRMS